MNVTLEDLDAAVDEGKTIFVNPFPDTPVAIQGKNKDHIRQVVMALQPISDHDIEAGMDGAMHQVQLIMAYAYNYDPDLVRAMAALLVETYE